MTKRIIAVLVIAFTFGAVAQNQAGNSNMVIIDNSGDFFYLIIDDVVQNVLPKKQLKTVAIPASYHKVKVVYSNTSLILQEHVTFLPFKQYTGFINWENGQKRLEWVEVANINQSNYGHNIEMAMFTSPYNVPCHFCTTPGQPGYHYHADGTVHSNCCGSGNTHPPIGNYPPNQQNCYNVMPTIQPIMDELKNIPFAAKKMEYAMDALANKCINSDQAYEIVAAFTFDNDRVKIAKYCYDRMADQLYANKLLDLFPHSSTREEVRKYFTK